MTRPALLLHALGFAALVAPPVFAEQAAGPASAAAARFVECLEAESAATGGEGSASVATAGDDAPSDAAPSADELAEALAGSLSHFDGIDCAVRADECVRAINAATCEQLASAWLGDLAPRSSASPAPAWAVAYGSAVADRVLACYGAELGAAVPEADAAAIAGYADTVARGMAAVAEQMRCTVDEDAASRCAASMRAMPCAGLAQELAVDASGNFTDMDPACGEMLDCNAELDAAIEQNREQSSQTGD